ncbi:type IV secretory system conjugative DNA transfer family protein [Chelatococcus asaccharovorans]|uniref:Type IV secretory pathway TraG/TraD family ATPase VirD4 n=1 Tax=Chelatococcus asaccharovorans TaxID=28210 RepID=A0A2V3TSG4_9HYPH|nr:type IV secretory system conjugative DNA transfer family protein [Chelatococcus asaccharovorans]MBS7708167.1 type IV secretory system conjugative DNA transfer family protein [Chelatococcus asaccharovorans]PXW50107.1 type IV secretory pathway TraG/TraD family ATPase VirD4 [Chelatococcus asaccharovorans]
MAYKFDNPAPYRFHEGALFLGLDQHGQEIGYETEIHALTVGGSGTGKGAGLLVQNARRWPHNLLVIDPKGENATLAWQAREALGQEVAVIDPFEQIPRGQIPDRLRVAINPLADIDPASPRARAALLSIGSGLVVSHNADHMEWTEGARSILSGLCAYVVANAPPAARTFATVREILMQDEQALYEDAQRMADDARLGGLIRSAGRMICTALTTEKAIERQFLGLAQRSTQWLDDDAIAAALGHSDFRLSDLKTGKASLFLVLPPDYIANYSAFLRLFVKSALHEMGKPVEGGRRCLFLLDEFFSLGKLEEVAEASGRMRSMGVTLWPFVQGLGQLNDLYGQEGAQTFLTNAAVHCFLGNDKDGSTLRYISGAIGNLTPEEIAEGPPQHRAVIEHDAWAARDNAQAVADHNYAMQRAGKPRLTPDEIAALIGKDEAAGDTVARSMIVFLPRGKVLQLRLAPYFMQNRAAQPWTEAAPVKPSPTVQGSADNGSDGLEGLQYAWALAAVGFGLLILAASAREGVFAALLLSAPVFMSQALALLWRVAKNSRSLHPMGMLAGGFIGYSGIIWFFAPLRDIGPSSFWQVLLAVAICAIAALIVGLIGGKIGRAIA